MSSLACLQSQPLSLPTVLLAEPSPIEQSVVSTPSLAEQRFLHDAVNALVAIIYDTENPSAPRPSSDAFASAARFLTMLSPTAPVPEISVDADGDVAIDWDFGPRRVFSVRVGQGGRLYYAGLFGHSTLHGSENLGAWIPWAIQGGIQQVLGSPPI